VPERLPLRRDVLEVGQRLEVRAQVLGVEPGLEPCPAEPLRLLLATGGEQRRHPGPVPVAGPRLLEREGPQLLQVPERELGRGTPLEGGERLVHPPGREQAGRDRGRPPRRAPALLVPDERVHVALVVGDVLQGATERAGGRVVPAPRPRARRQGSRHTNGLNW
jgi:hypothetical protein